MADTEPVPQTGPMLPVEADSDRPGWQDFANCLGVDPDMFFPERGASTREAKEVCAGCIVRAECLEYALANGKKFGIWGGLSERERRNVRRQRIIARRAALESLKSAVYDGSIRQEIDDATGNDPDLAV